MAHRANSWVLLVSMLILLFFGMPHATHASTLTKRTCDRQRALGNRLASWFINPAKCTDTTPPTPTLNFTADPNTVTKGTTSTLTWLALNADDCKASDAWHGWKPTDGSAIVKLKKTKTFTLTCTGDGGKISKSVTVTVGSSTPPVPDAPTLSFTATPSTITTGATSTLTWSTTNATACTATNAWGGSKATSSSEMVSPNATSTYSLSCSGAGGTVVKSVTVNVTVPQQPPAPVAPTLSLQANPTHVEEGSPSNATSTLTWSTTNATTCSASGGWSGGKAVNGTEVVAPLATTSYSLICSGAGGSVSATTTIAFTAAAPQPAQGKLLISEVMYDTDATQGTEPANEWVELYNGTGSAINLAGYYIHDASSTDALPAVLLPAGAYGFITGSSTTAALWPSMPVGTVILLLSNTTIGNGLGNAGDMVWLESNASSTVDVVSWGTNNTPLFAPSVADVVEGHTIARSSVTVDTDNASDWVDNATPNPGQ